MPRRLNTTYTMNKPLPYPPPWMDMPTLCAHICATPNTVDKWVSERILPPPVKRGGKQMWEWAVVEQWLKNGNGTETLADRIRDGTRREQAESRTGH